MDQKRGLGFWFLIVIACLLAIWFILGQTLCIFFYDFTVSLGFQDSINDVTAVGVAFNKGFGIADTLFYIPLLISGIIGILKKKRMGIYLMFSALAITVYWPIVCLSAVYFAKGDPGWNLTSYAEYTMILSLITVYGVWGMCFVYINRARLIK
jgi:hypothetical protein